MVDRQSRRLVDSRGRARANAQTLARRGCAMPKLFCSIPLLPAYFYRSRYLHVILGTIRVCRSLQLAENALVRCVSMYIYTRGSQHVPGICFVGFSRRFLSSTAFLPASLIAYRLLEWKTTRTFHSEVPLPSWRWIPYQGNSAVYFSLWTILATGNFRDPLALFLWFQEASEIR